MKNENKRQSSRVIPTMFRFITYKIYPPMKEW